MPPDPVGLCKHVWKDADISCDDCGDHMGVMCEVCWDTLDFVWDDDPRKRVD